MSRRKKQTSDAKDKTDYFSWSDDEVELLLSSTMDYKTSKEMENIDWESCQSKYQDIHDKFVEHYPAPEEAKALGKEYPHSKSQMTKAILTSKLKTVRQKYRLAVDDGRRSGHGRVVLLYFELCEKIWGGSPASTAISSGIKTAELSELLTDSDEISHSRSNTPECSINSTSTDNIEDSSESQDIEEILPSTVVQERRNLLNSKLAGHKHEKLKRKLPNDSQLVTCAQEELKIKKQMLERMEVTDKQHAEYMNKMFANMKRLTNSIADGFGLLRQIMVPQHPFPPPQPHYYHQSQPSAYMPSTPVSHQMDRQNSGQYSFTSALFSDES